ARIVHELVSCSQRAAVHGCQIVRQTILRVELAMGWVGFYCHHPLRRCVAVECRPIRRAEWIGRVEADPEVATSEKLLACGQKSEQGVGGCTWRVRTGRGIDGLKQRILPRR